jgi:hypothetical protein
MLPVPVPPVPVPPVPSAKKTPDTESPRGVLVVDVGVGAVVWVVWVVLPLGLAQVLVLGVA